MAVKIAQSPAVPQLNGLRALCVLVIIFHHWTGAFIHLRFPFEAGAFFFFVLSGFLITRILLYAKEQSADKPHIYRNFIIRRSLRIFPGYLLILGICFWLQQADVRENLLWYLSGFVNIHFAFDGWQGGADQFWTLAIEQQFYLLWPLGLLFLPRKPALVLLCLAFVLPTLARLLPGLIGENPLTQFLRPSQLWGQSLEMTGKLTWNAFDYLSAGCLYAYARHEKWSVPKVPAHLLGAFSATAYLAIRLGYFHDYLPPQFRVLQQLFLIMATVWVVHLAADGIPGLIGTALEHPVMQSIGTRSYGLYLYHNLIGGLFYIAFKQEGHDLVWLPAVFLGASILVWIMACLSWKFLEEPIYRQKAKFPYSRTKPESGALTPR